jgi:hypothetical protein
MLKSGPHRRPGEESWRDDQTLFIRGFKVAVRSSGAPPSIGSDEDPEADQESLSECAPNVSGRMVNLMGLTEPSGVSSVEHHQSKYPQLCECCVLVEVCRVHLGSGPQRHGCGYPRR